MIRIKKKKTKKLARILALVGTICVIFATFALPAFAWGNMTPAGNASNAGVYTFSPIHTVEFVKITDSGNRIASTYAPNNYLNLNNRSNYSPSFPQTQTSGVQSTTVTIDDSYQLYGYEQLYKGETTFSPSYYGEGAKGYLNVRVDDTFLLLDEFSKALYGNSSKPIYKYMTYVTLDPNGYDPDFGIAPDVVYNCTYFYLDDNGNLSCKSGFNNSCMNEWIDTGNSNYIYYLYDDMFNKAPENLLYIYVDYLYCSTDTANYDDSFPVSYGNTYSTFTNDDLLDFESVFSEVGNSSALLDEIEFLKAERNALQKEYDYYYSETEYWRSKYTSLEAEKSSLENSYYDLLVEIAGVRDDNLALENEIKDLEAKNFELRNTTGAIDEYFTGISSARWGGLEEISDIGYSFVDSDGITQTVTVGNLITIFVIGVVAFFVIKLFRGG